jgi:hypothetical protein
MRSRTRGRATILKILRGYVNFERFASGMGERTVETNFSALDGEIANLRQMAADLNLIAKKAVEGVERGSNDHKFAVFTADVGAKIGDAADRLNLVVHDLKSRALQPADYVRDRTRIYRDSWINPLIDELERKEKKRGQ